MTKPLLGKKIAVLVANGFSEKDLTLTQKALFGSGADLRIVSVDQGLVNSWNEDGWGLNYAADQILSQALAADFDMLIVPGGQRSIEKLELTAHTRRFIGGFVDTHKPVVIYEDAMELLIFSERLSGLTVSGPERFKARAEAGGATWSDEPYSVSGGVLSGVSDLDSRDAFAVRAGAFLVHGNAVDSKEQEAVAA